jgi:YidC/Oxa1 family membrane protein insertase
VDELNHRYRNDPQRRATEIAALFKEHGISPWSGCLPALLPAPIYLALYHVLAGLTRRQPGGVTFRPRFIPHSSRLFHALAASTTMQAWGVDLARTGVAALQLSPASAGLFVAAAAVTVLAGVCQQRLVRAALPRPEAPTAALIDRLSPVVPALFAIWGLLLPLAVTLYYASSSIVRLAQQWFLIKAHPF